MNDQLVETWATWLDKSVASDVYLMHLEWHVWREMHDVISKNDRLKTPNASRDGTAIQAISAKSNSAEIGWTRPATLSSASASTDAFGRPRGMGPR